MTVPLFGFFFIPVALWIFFAKPYYLVPLLVLSSIFEAASVLNLNLGDFPVGIQPYYFVAVLLAIRACWGRNVVRNRLRLLSPGTKRALWALAAFWAWAVAGSFLLPVVFKGVGVLDPRSTLGQVGPGADVALNFALHGELTPLRWGFRNLGQAAYLTLNTVAVIYAAAMGLKVAHSRRALKALRAGIVVASVIVFAQAVASLMNWNFPYWFFNSNPVYSQAYDQVVAGLRRSNSTFTEPSYAGGFLAAAALGLVSLGLCSVRKRVLMTSSAVVACLLTTASTGLGTLIIGGVLIAIRRSKSALRSAKQSALTYVRGGGLRLLLLTGGAVGLVLVFSPRLDQAVLEMTVYKLGTLSALGRIPAGIYSAGLVLRTYGLGLGLGSNRPYDLLTYILSNLGVVGVALFALFFVRLLRQLFGASHHTPSSHIVMVTWMLLGLLIAQMAAIPDINWPATWAVVALSLCLLASCDGVHLHGKQDRAWKYASGNDRARSAADG